jgi:hypothetical protein
MLRRMKPHVLLLTLIALSGSANACEKVSIAGVSPGMDAIAVKAIFGVPAKIFSNKENFISTTFEYGQLRVGFDEDMRVASIESRSQKYCFNKWLCPGMTAAAVKSRMSGKKFVVSGDKEKLTIYDDSCWAEITSNRVSIESVAILCQP